MKSRWLVSIWLLLSLLFLLGAAAGEWLTKVPAHEHQKTNPLRDQTEAIQAGQLLFAEHCVSCHGQDAEGKKGRPSLRSSRIQNEASEGDLHWFLVNGNPRRGMPSWSRLPDPQLWQLISYLKSLMPKN
ncbi:MAG TPA: c-type cytochrome [Candidatus Angelobacter sp.]|nr:c-type cytochrome [Candidatus Angelobacter sp.]